MKKKWFKEVEESLEKYNFYKNEEYKRCGSLIITNFSWHFDYEVPPEQNELVTHFTAGEGPYILKTDTILKYLDIAAKQYGVVPALEHEFKNKKIRSI
jgi:hypothetical protein